LRIMTHAIAQTMLLADIFYTRNVFVLWTFIWTSVLWIQLKCACLGFNHDNIAVLMFWVIHVNIAVLCVLWYNHVNSCHAYRLSRNLAGQIDVFSPFLFCALAREKWTSCVGPALVCMAAAGVSMAADADIGA
jgi:hypothetical protein